MGSSIKERLDLLLNYGVKNLKDLSPDEKIITFQKFNEEVSIQKYNDFFHEIENYLQAQETIGEEKEEIISKTFEFIRKYPSLYENLNLLPLKIQEIINSYQKLTNIILLFEQITNLEITALEKFEKIMLKYFDYLDSPLNEFYIINNYGRIEKFNHKISNYLKQKDFNGIMHQTNITNYNSELINTLNSKIICKRKNGEL